MGFKKLMGLFVDYDEDPKEEKKDEKEVAEEKVEEAIKPASAPAPVAMPTSTVSGETNQEILESLASALENANMDGFDYFEFAQVHEKLKKSMPSEEARFKAAFTSGSVMGVTRQKLLETAQHYLGVLNQEAEKFAQFYNDQLKRTVSDREESLTGMDESIKEKKAMIDQLNDEINQLTNDKSAINAEIIENKGKAEKVKNDFMATMDIFVSRINGDIEKIGKYITEE